MTPRAVEMVPILRPAFARVRIANEIRMQFRRERKSGSTVSLQETLEADGESALTLADVLQDGFCMEECCEKKADLLRVRQLLETLPARERQILLLRYGLAGQPPLTQLETAAAGHQPQLCVPSGKPRAVPAAPALGQKNGAGVKHFSCAGLGILIRSARLPGSRPAAQRCTAGSAPRPAPFWKGAAAGPVHSTALPYALRCPACRRAPIRTGPCR